MEKLSFWIKKIDAYLEKLDEIPLFRGEKFSFTDFSSNLKKELDIEDFQISCHPAGWQRQDELKQTLGETIHQLCFVFTPLLGNAYFLIGKEEIESLTYNLLSIDKKSHLPSATLEEGFYRYLVLLALNQLTKTLTFEGLSPKIVEKAEIKSEYAFCLDITIKANKNIYLNGKIAITPDFRKSWNDFFLSRKSIGTKLLESSVELPLQAVVGTIRLKRKELQSLKEGDFVILDESYVPTEGQVKGIVLKLGNYPIFFANIENNIIHIIDYADYYPEGETMEENQNKEIPPEGTPPLIPKENMPSSEREPPYAEEEELSSLEDLPVKVTVELARISLPIEKLISLAPGNILQLPSSIDTPVRLTVNGKKIGTAEITIMGEHLGIRILTIS